MADWNWDLVRAQCLREARGVLGASGTAEDAAQEAAVRAWRRRDSCQNPERPAPWISRIARNEALRFVRPLRTDFLEETDLPAEESHEDEVLGKTDLARALDRLQGVDRELVRGRFWDDLDYRQLSLRLDITEGTARVRLHRALGRLREALVET
ncbi:MAG TPA: sigma-70 family RNA polymerase sigma factor [Solirubrobacteraceae bacterium]|nr:sigma-70 family RNA polymerase sigma factor [Solirubrobacteraceae bacterium]